MSVDNYPPYNFNRYYNRKAQGECVDYVVVMCYDEHYNGGEKAGSTSSLKYLVNGMNGTLEEVDKEKLLWQYLLYKVVADRCFIGVEL